jgi:LysR family transcriptional regulator, glycine cleavage system transcriptional activator
MENLTPKLPPLEWIRAFEAAARCGSFTAAGADTGLTQSAISQRISQLESHLGATLFHRRARSIELTIEGEAWLPHVRMALNSLRESSDAIFGASRGRLTISASQSITDLWLLPRLGKLQALTNSQISLQTMVLGAHSAPQDDVVRIRYGSGDWPHTYRMKLYSEEIVPVAAPSLTKQFGHWSEWARITCSGPRPSWNDWSARFGIPTTPVPKLRFDTFLSALGAARVGMGVFLASLPLCERDVANGSLVRLEEEALQHHESYWLLAGHEAMTKPQWQALSAALQ